MQKGMAAVCVRTYLHCHCGGHPLRCLCPPPSASHPGSPSSLPCHPLNGLPFLCWGPSLPVASTSPATSPQDASARGDAAQCK